MRKVLLVIALVSVSLTCAFKGYASFESVELEEKWDLGISMDAVFISDDDLSDGMQVIVSGSYNIMQYVAIGIEGGWMGLIDVDINGNEGGEFDAYPILGDVILKYPMEIGDGYMVMVPYISNGFGIVIPHFQTSDTLEAMNIKVDYDPAFMYKLKGGIDFYITELLAICFNAGYQWAHIDGEAKIGGNKIASGSNKLDSFFVGGGIKLKF